VETHFCNYWTNTFNVYHQYHLVCECERVQSASSFTSSKHSQTIEYA